ncbi:CoA ester lyase [Sphingomonas sp. So64.6b]|uniref:HpcH/HpaI aldolase/citrate lyase family protein n=1 Tax=Sphingomonas sp. So64.6b TaxID=2997354 RepID=UPI0023DDC9ED|nr:CoA ester lyase [Sphingomonas sp. So64.6b]
MPASNLRAIEKARELPCDAVVLDLEDAVAPEAKVAARETAVAVVREGGFGQRALIVRANGIDTPWGRDDLTALALAGPDAILVPKVNDGAEVAAYDAAIAAAPGHTRLWAMIETARSMFRLEEIAAQARTTRLAAWVMGTNDLAKEMRATLDVARVPFLGFLAQSVAAARAHGLTILDGVYNSIEDEAGLEAQCRQARAFGFDGKTLIHPKQIAVCNRAFTPSEAEVAAARVVVAAFGLPENADKGALRVEGRMVERLHLAEAEAVIALWEMVSS